DAGIGKSTIWRNGVEHAAATGWRVLAAGPAEAERGLAHAGLGDLLEGTIDGVLPSLPPPRRRALEVALLLDEPEAGPADPRALGIALRSVLQLLAAQGPLLVAIDDVQWLDAASRDALAFALRRLDTPAVRVLLARRGAGEALGLTDAQRVEVG